MNDALAFTHQLGEPPVRSVGNDEIGVEKKQKRFRHLRAQVDEAAEQCSRQNDAVLAGLARHQIIKRGELNLADRSEPLERARLADVIDELAFGDEHDLDIEHCCKRREVARREQRWQRHRRQLFGVNRAPKRDDQTGWWSHWLSGLTKPGIRLAASRS